VGYLLRAAAVVAGLYVVSGFAGGASAAMFNPKTFTLDNGLTFVVVENHRAPVVEQMVWYRVGAADERPGESGLAHFLEHLMFKGTEKVKPQEFSKIIARNGGQDNAFTTADYTAYFEKIAKDRLELVMGLEADRMHNLRLTDKEVLPEREVVREERRMRVDNRPSAVLSEQSQAQFWLNSPYARPVIGWPFEIEALTTEKALAFYNRHYMPNNAVVVVAGDVTLDEVKAIAERTYGKVPRGTVPVRNRPAEPEHHVAMQTSMISDQVREPSWSRSYMAPSYRTDEDHHAYALQVLAEIVGGGATSRLYRDLVVGKGVANEAGAWYAPNQYAGTEFSVYATPREGTDLAKLQAAIDGEIARVRKSGVTAAELADAKASIVARAIYAQDSLGAAPNWIGRGLMTGSTLADIEAWPERIQAVTAEQVNDAARAVLAPAHSMTATLLPAETGGPARPGPSRPRLPPAPIPPARGVQ
jgi:zinc protease